MHLTATLAPEVSNYLVRAMFAGHGAEHDAVTIVTANAMTLTMPLRTLWGLLATLNDLPVVIENVTPSRGYIARGSYKKFLEHSTFA